MSPAQSRNTFSPELVFLAHDDVDLLAPLPEALAVPAVLVAVGELGLVFLPEQAKGHVLMPEFPLDLGPVRHPLRVGLQGSPLAVEPALEFALRSSWPASGQARPVISKRVTVSHTVEAETAAGPGDLVIAETRPRT